MKKGLIGLQLGISILLFFAPFFFGAVYQWAFMSVYAVIFLLLAAYPESLSRVHILPVPLRLGTAILYGVLLIHSLWVPPDKYSALMGVGGWITLAVLFCLIQELDHESILRLMILIGLVGALESFYGVMMTHQHPEMVLWMPKSDHWGYATGTFFNRNHLAGYLEMVLGVQLGLVFYSLRFKRWIAALMSAGLFMVSLYGLSMSGSRMGIASLLTSLFVCMPFLVKKYKNSFPVILAVLLTVALIGVFGHEVLKQRFFLTEGHIENNSGRPMAWLSTLALIRDHFWTGVGFGHFNWFFPGYQPAELQMGWDHAHNDYLELAANLGVPLCFSVIILAGMFTFFALKKFFDLQNGHEFIVWGIFVSLLSLGLHGLGDFNFAIPSNLLLWIALAAMGWNLLFSQKDGGPYDETGL